MKSSFLLSSFLLLLLGALSPLSGSEWQRPVVNFTRYDYQAGTQNWMLEQQDNGWIYAANNKGLLEFDGTSWHLYSMHGVRMQAVKKGHDGRIYVGGIAQFGYFEPDRLGRLRYVSLSDGLSRKVNIGVIRNIIVEPDRVCFQADRYLFLQSKEGMEVLDCGGEIAATGRVGQQLYLLTERGLSRVEGNRLVSVEGTEAMGQRRRAYLLSWQGRLLLATRYDGLFLYDPLQGVSRLKCAAEAFIRQNGVYSAGIRGSLLALGTMQEGVCLLDLATDRMEVLSVRSGLQNQMVRHLLFDVEGNLWLALDNGLDYVQLRSPLRLLHSGRTPIGSGYASCLYKGRLYLGTNQGIYCTTPPDSRLPETNETIDFVAGSGGQVWSFLEHDGKLFCASDNGVLIWDGTRLERLSGVRGVRRIIALPGHPDVLVAGAYGVNRGLHLLRKQEGRWMVEGAIEGCDISCRALLADPADHRIWIANKGDGVFRMKLSEDLRKVEWMRHLNSSLLPSDHDVCLAPTNRGPIVASRCGLWRYQSKTDSLVRADDLEQLLDGTGIYTYLYMDSKFNIWYADGHSMKLVRYDPVQNVYRKYASDLFLPNGLISHSEAVSLCGENAVIGSEDGFALLDLQEKPTVRRMPPTLEVRRVYLTTGRDSLVYGRSYLPDSSRLVVPYVHNSLRIEFCADNYGGTRPLRYAHRLSRNGEEGTWSEYSGINLKEYTGLQEGRYLFSVRLERPEGEAPILTSFAFEVLPPWYRTWWSYLIYLSLLSLLGYYVYARIRAGHRHLVMQQELELLKQQQEFQKESELKDQRIVSLEEENLQSELRHKSEELVRTTLNIVRKNEMLTEIKKEVLGISHAIGEENLVAVRRKTLRLLGQIDTNIEHDDDLQAFQSTFDSVHHDFFRKLEEAYPELSHKEKLLCAYLKMNLLSKEIAPLMNISLRGVEISRYRLRKKLALPEGANLAEFLQRFGS